MAEQLNHIVRGMLFAVRQSRSESTPTWHPNEIRSIRSARSKLKKLSSLSPTENLLDALKCCFPFECAMIETVRASRPSEPAHLICGVPHEFVLTRARLIEQDLAIPLGLRLDAGTLFRDVDAAEESALRRIPYIQELYPPGCDLGGVSILIIDAKPRYLDSARTLLFLFRGKNDHPPASRVCHMLEAMYGDVRLALERLRVPVLPHRTIDFQIMEEKQDGYALLRMNGSLLEANRQAFVLADNYYKTSRKIHNLGNLLTFLQSLGATKEAHLAPCRIRRSDGRAVLEVVVIDIRRAAHDVPEDLVLVRMSEVPTEALGFSEMGRRLLATMPSRLRLVACMLVNTQLTAKEIATKLGTSHRTVETQVCNVYASLGVRSRQELVRLLAA